MAKDPAFLFYDGDAARDVSHMNRLERGCYFDIIQAQRKFGRLNISLIKKILGHEFETCWESVKICLTYENDMFYIEWLENSTIKRKAYTESRSKNRRKTEISDNQTNTNNDEKTYDEHMKTYVKHMENENEIVIEDENIKGVQGENFSFPKITYYENDGHVIAQELTNSYSQITAIRKEIYDTTKKDVSEDEVILKIPQFVSKLSVQGKFPIVDSELKTYFGNWCVKQFTNGNNAGNNQKPDKVEETIRAGMAATQRALKRLELKQMQNE